MNTTRWTLFTAILLAYPAVAQQSRPRLHELNKQSQNVTTGPAVGSRLPEFTVMDREGKPQTFASLRGPKGLMLVFARSADWCPYCKTQMVELQGRLEDVRKQGLNIAVLTYDSPAILNHFAARQKITYPMLPDPESKVIRLFGILNTNVEPGTMAYGIPFPGTYIVDASGVIRAKYFEDDYTERYSAADILTHEFGLDGVQKTTVETPHLKLTYSSSDTAFSPGRRIALIAEIEMKPGLHVYAPGVEHGYIPISWTMADSKTSIALPVEFPKARTMEFSALKEIVPVYEGKLRLVRDLSVGTEREVAEALHANRELTVQGTFRYQACNDRECFPPRSLPLQWTFQLGTMDTVRPPAEIQHQ